MIDQGGGQLCIIEKNGQRRYKYHVLGRDRSDFAKATLILPNSSLKLISSQMLEFLIDNIFVMFSTDTNCAHLLADLFLYSHEVYFIYGLLKKNEMKLSDPLIACSAI